MNDWSCSLGGMDEQRRITIRPYTKRTQRSVFASPVHEFPDFGNNDGTFTNRGSDTLD
jgi:hypothetical protein